ncbi:MAG: transcription-repair coupling factor, partial [Bacteroidaceae bacterium]|nr:transcription-repair coupling factor [Bacteroidaceae bacterium]
AIGHGRMSPEDLERVVLDFANYEYDVLISTTIIESGIDIPNANTIIINGANHFGLSDLHQMRGRVGRSNKKAFCYLLAPPLGSLPEDARRRLQAIENFAHLGSGIHIAMQDLDIRGAGNLLGAEQSGFIADLGYEAYQKILAEAMRELKREEEESGIDGDRQEDVRGVNTSLAWVDECQLESDLPLFFSEDFVPTSSERMLLYRELDNLTDDDQLTRFRERLVDRFGNPPVEAEELMRVPPLKRLGVEMGCDRIVLKNKRMRMFFTADERTSFYQSDVFGQCITFATMHVTRTTMAEVNGRRLMTIKNVPTVSAAVEILGQMKNIKQ